MMWDGSRRSSEVTVPFIPFHTSFQAPLAASHKLLTLLFSLVLTFSGIKIKLSLLLYVSFTQSSDDLHHLWNINQVLLFILER